MIVKLDMENAFDRVSHPYLMVVLHKLGFLEEIKGVI